MSEEIKVIFLDIDGVMNHTADWVEMRMLGHPQNKGTDVINRSKLALLEHILDTTGALIVLSSTWRLHYSNVEMVEKFQERGSKITLEQFHGQTDDIGGYRGRGIEVAKYLDEHPEIKKYAILDDCQVFLATQQTNFVQTDSDCGLTLDKANEVIDILGTLNGKRSMIITL